MFLPHSRLLIVLGIISLVALAALQAGLPHDTFVAGDSGVKLVATRNAVARPSTPLEIPLPAIEGETVPYVEPFYRQHGDHTHAVTPETFVLASAPFLRTFGIRGVYVLPALGALLAIVAWTWIGLQLAPALRPSMLFLTAVFGTPWVFYGLEFWEHAPAAGAAAVGTAFFLHAVRRRATPPSFLGAGVCFGLTVLFRPEAVWYVAAVFAAWIVLNPRRWMPVAVSGLAVSLVLAPWAYLTYAHFRTFASPHLGGLGSVFGVGWFAARLGFIYTWFLSPSTSNFWWIAPLVLIGLVPVRGAIPNEWRRFLLLVSAATVAGVIATAPNDGGAQWGPRYLLLAYGPLVPLAADVLQAITRRGTVGIVVVALALVGSGWIQRDGYRDLRGTKETYGRFVTFVRDNASAGRYVVTDLWWLDQVVATIDDITFLYTPTQSEAATVFARLASAGVQRVVVIVGSESPALREPMLSPACYRETGRRSQQERSLIAVTFELTCANR